MKRPLLLSAGIAVGAGLAASAVTLGSAPLPSPAPALPTAPLDDPAAPLASPTPTTYDPTRSLAPLVEAVGDAVVAIEIEGTRPVAANLPPGFERFFGMPPDAQRRVEGEGSGVVIGQDGLVLTNHHVIAEADNVQVRFGDGELVDATLIGSDPSIDIALLRLPTDRDWPYLPLADSQDVRVGDWVVAAGNPLGLGNTFTQGIVSGKGRALGMAAYDSFLQTDAAINQGNSGGPLLNLDGEVIGINTAIIQGANTVGFAVPTALILPVLEDLETTGRVARGFIGVRHQPVTEELAAAMGLPTKQGALIAEVVDDMPADKAGLRQGDVITHVDGEEIVGATGLAKAIGSRRPGDRVEVQVLREGRSQDLQLTLTEMPGTPDPRPAQSQEEPAAASALGLGVRELDARMAQDLGLSGGLLIERVDRGSVADGQLQPGDVIVEVNQRPIRGVRSLERALTSGGEHVLFVVVRGEAQQFVAIERP